MGDTDDLRQPLLAEPTDSCPDHNIDPNHTQNSPSSGLVHSLLARLRNVLAVLWNFLTSLLPFKRQVKLSAVEAARLSKLKQRAAIPYESEHPEHIECLKRLWKAAWPDIDFPQDIKCSQWKSMGWQGEDPGTDFRGGGLLSLELLVHMAENEQRLFLDLMNKVEGPRSDLDYPFAAAGVNLTYMLVETLELRKPEDHIPKTAAARGFLTKLSYSDTALEAVFVEAFQKLDKVWIQSGATYMQFPNVMDTLKQEIIDDLSKSR